MRLIDADALLEQVQFRLPNGRVIADCVEITRRLIEAAPTIDAVPVVRCGHCESFDTTGFDPDPDSAALSVGYCRMHRRNFQACDFCSYGERRTDD